MRTVAHAVERVMQGHPLYGEALRTGIVNASSLARKLHTEVEEILFEPVTQGAIVIALKRYATELAKKQSVPIPAPEGIALRSNLSIYVFRNAPGLQSVHQKLLESKTTKDDALVHFSQGTRESSFVISDELTEVLKKLTEQECLIAEYHNLSSLSIRMPSEIMEHVGVFAPFVQLLAWQNISVYQVMSYFTEIAFVLSNHDAEKAFAAIQSFTRH